MTTYRDGTHRAHSVSGRERDSRGRRARRDWAEQYLGIEPAPKLPSKRRPEICVSQNRNRGPRDNWAERYLSTEPQLAASPAPLPESNRDEIAAMRRRIAASTEWQWGHASRKARGAGGAS